MAPCGNKRPCFPLSLEFRLLAFGFFADLPSHPSSLPGLAGFEAVSMPPGSFAPNRGVAAGLKITKKHSEQRRHCGVLNGVRGEDEDLKLKILPFSESQT
ncbi:hypothetical protein RUM44_011045 [Polyplax serrata]|uniref:Uncharacterized protein n=1 Tax=Polyplax serrata TaxID=468196 RepID=A0ABR1ANX3_POLSC